MIENLIGGECQTCRHRVGWDCRRTPQVVTKLAWIDGSGNHRDVEWGFPPAGLRCAEFKANDAELMRLMGLRLNQQPKPEVAP